MLIPFEFFIFGMMLAGIAILHHHAKQAAFFGLASLVVYKLFLGDIDLVSHMLHEAKTVINLFGLLVGFELLARHFELSGISEKIGNKLPTGWLGPFCLLLLIFICSGFLDNIAAAMIGHTIARTVFMNKVKVGYLMAIVTASNAGGAGSVLGDTTTTMMWIEGVSPWDVLHAYVPALTALFVFSIPLSIMQNRYQGVVRQNDSTQKAIDVTRLGIVVLMLVGVIITNIAFDFPALGLWIAILTSVPIRKPAWSEIPGAASNASFLLALVVSASLMPVETLPTASPQIAILIGYLSRVFDNIPLTKLALEQGGYDWAWVAYSVGVGGSMFWFGSSAGVAVAKHNPEMRNMWKTFKESWWLEPAFIAGFIAVYLVFGWVPHEPIKSF